MGYNLFDYRSVSACECVQDGTAITQESVCFQCMDFEEKYNELKEENIALQKKLVLSQNMYECAVRDLRDIKEEVSKYKSDIAEKL
jgi:hypothetical protein